MAKKEIKTMLKSNEILEKHHVISIVTNHTLIFNEDKVKVTIKKNNNTLLMIRENDEYQLTLEFKKEEQTRGIYLLKENNLALNLNILTKELIIDNNYIKVVYELNDELREYSINIEE